MATVVSPSGEMLSVPDGAMEQAQAAGYQPASPALLQSLADRQQTLTKYGDTLSAIEAGLEGAASAATFGVSDVVESGLFNNAEEMRGREEAQGFAHSVGAGVGLVAPALLSGGTSLEAEGAAGAGEAAAAGAEAAPGLLETGARVAGAPVRAVSEMGAGIRRALAGGVEGPVGAFGPRTAGLLPQATSRLGNVAREATAAAAGMGAEGAVYGAGNVLHQEALGEQPTGQQMAGELAGSALFAGGLGGLAAGMGASFQALRDAAGDANLEWAAGQPPGESTKDMLFRRRDDFLSVAKGAPKASQLMERMVPEQASVILDNPDAVAKLAQVEPDIVSVLGAATPPTAKWMLDNAGPLAELEKLKHGTVARIPNMEAADAQLLADKWPLIYRGFHERSASELAVIDSLQGVYDAANEALRRAHEDIFPQEAEKNLVGMDPTRPMDALSDVKTGLGKSLLTLGTDPEYGRGYTGKLTQFASAFTQQMNDAASGAPEKQALGAYEALRDLRRNLGSIAHFGDSDQGLAQTELNSRAVVRDLYHEVGRTLKNEDIFGDQAARRASIDEAYSNWTDLAGKQGEFRKEFMRQVGSEKGTAGWQIVPTKVETWMNGLIKNRGAFKSATWGRLTDAAGAVADQLDEAGVPDDANALRQRIVSAEQRVDAELERAHVSATQKMLSSDVKGAAMPSASAASMPGARNILFGLSYLGGWPWGSIIRAGASLGRAVGPSNRALLLAQMEKSIGMSRRLAGDFAGEAAARAPQAAREAAAGMGAAPAETAESAVGDPATVAEHLVPLAAGPIMDGADAAPGGVLAAAVKQAAPRVSGALEDIQKAAYGEDHASLRDVGLHPFAGPIEVPEMAQASMVKAKARLDTMVQRRGARPIGTLPEVLDAIRSSTPLPSDGLRRVVAEMIADRASSAPIAGLNSTAETALAGKEAGELSLKDAIGLLGRLRRDAPGSGAAQRAVEGLLSARLTGDAAEGWGRYLADREKAARAIMAANKFADEPAVAPHSVARVAGELHGGPLEGAAQESVEAARAAHGPEAADTLRTALGKHLDMVSPPAGDALDWFADQGRVRRAADQAAAASNPTTMADRPLPNPRTGPALVGLKAFREQSEQRTADAARAVVEGGAPPEMRLPDPPETAKIAEQMDRIGQLAGDPQALSDAANSHLGPLDTHAPNIAQAARMALTQGVLYLASQLPDRPAPALGSLDRGLPSRAAAVEWHQRAQAVRDPQAALASIHSLAVAETLAAVYRGLAPRMQMEMVRTLTADGRLPTAQEIARVELMSGLRLSAPLLPMPPMPPMPEVTPPSAGRTRAMAKAGARLTKSIRTPLGQPFGAK